MSQLAQLLGFFIKKITTLGLCAEVVKRQFKEMVHLSLRNSNTSCFLLNMISGPCLFSKC